MSNELIPRRGLESLKKEAKRWLDALQSNSADAHARLRRILPDAPTNPTLRDVQHALAREHGFSGWTALKERIEDAPLKHFEEAAAALLLAYRTGTPEAMEAHYRYTWHRRPWTGMRTYVQLDLGKRPAEPGGNVEITLDDARYLVAGDYGFRDWNALKAAIASGTTIDVGGSRDFTDDDLRKLANTPDIKRLDLSGTSITDAAIEILQHLPDLESVNLSWTRTGDAAIRALAGKERLRHFHSGQFVTDAGIPLLHELPVFKIWQGGDRKMALLSYSTEPNQLILRGSFTDRGMHAMRGLDGLFGLNIDDSALALSAAAMEPLVALPNLGFLAADAKDDWMPYIAEMPKLRFLGAQDTTAGDDGFVALSKSRTIEYIWGRRCHNLRRRGFVALSTMPALRALSVSCLNVDDAGLSALPSFPALRELMPMDVPDAGYVHIGACENLESLILMYCRDTTDTATEHITRLRKLSYYFNSYTTITDRTPALLSEMDSLERITFSACHNLTDAGVARLARLPRLRELRVSGRGLTPAVANGFPPSVLVNPRD